MPLTSTPNASDVISATQPIIKDNFDQLITWMPINHVDSDLSNEGWHKNLTFPVALATANPALASTAQIAMLPFTGATSAVCELAVQKFGANPVAFTEGSVVANNGYSRLASGLLLKWGNATCNGSGVGAVVFTGPAFTTIFQVYLTAKETGAVRSVIVIDSGTPPTTAGFTALGSTLTGATPAMAAAAVAFSWYAIGIG